MVKLSGSGRYPGMKFAGKILNFTFLQCVKNQNFRSVEKYSVKPICTSLTRYSAKCMCHCVSSVMCGNYENWLSPFFGKNFVKVTVLLNKEITRY